MQTRERYDTGIGSRTVNYIGDNKAMGTQTPKGSRSIEMVSIRSPNETNIEPLMDMWGQSLAELQDRRVTAAYTRVLKSGDDLYLLRLMHKTGNCLTKLSSKV
jgi:hypothetical protein